MTSVDIEYCVPCGLLGRAQDVQEAVLEEFGLEVEEVSLVTGDDGVFEVRADGDVIFGGDDDYDVEEIVDDVRSYVGASG